MQFRVLGTLEIARDGELVAIGSPKQRQLLAVLLCYPNQVVRSERLADLLWQGSPPPSAASNLQTYVHRMRRNLDHPGRLRSVAGGYVLDVRPGELDAEQFETLIEQAERETDPATAVALRRSALQLWRGESFGGVDVDTIEPAAHSRTRLDELRLGVHERCVDDELALGRHGAVIAELTSLIAVHPYRERFVAQLMLALYRSGRKVEALAVYRKARAALVEDLGLEPGAEIRDLERAILTDDESPASAAPSLAGGSERLEAPVPVPAEMPPDVPTFTGRQPEIDELVAAVTQTSSQARVCCIDGAGGTGKSALAIHVGHHVRDRFPDGQVYVNLRGATPGMTPVSSGDALRRLLRSMGVAERDIPLDDDEAAARYRSLSARKHILIILDDAADEAQVRPLLPPTPGPAAIVTSRARLATLDVSRRVGLGPLDEDAAITLLARVADIQDGHGDAVETVRLCDRLPLAIRVAGARLIANDHLTLADLNSLLSDPARRLDVLAGPDMSVRATIRVGLDGLGGPRSTAPLLFASLSLLDVPSASSEVAAALTGRTLTATQADLDRLVEARLVEPVGPGRYVLHDLARLAGRELAAACMSLGEQDSAVERTLHWYVATLRNTLLHQGRGFGGRMTRGLTALKSDGLAFGTSQDAARWIDEEHDNLVAVLEHGVRVLDDGSAFAGALASAANNPLLSGGWFGDLMAVNAAALDVLGDSPDIDAGAYLRADIGWALCMIGRPAEAIPYFEWARDAWRSLDDGRGESVALGGLASAYAGTGRGSEALVPMERSVALIRSHNEVGELAAALSNLGVVYALAGRFGEALASYAEAAALAESVGADQSVSIALLNIGDIHLELDDASAALPILQRASEFATRGGSRLQFAKGRWLLGIAHHRLGRQRDADQEWRAAVDMLVEMGAVTAGEGSEIMADPVNAEPKPLFWHS